jgi:hypothetical protein
MVDFYKPKTKKIMKNLMYFLSLTLMVLIYSLIMKVNRLENRDSLAKTAMNKTSIGMTNTIQNSMSGPSSSRSPIYEAKSFEKSNIFSPPTNVEKAFKERYKSVNECKWVKDLSNYKASFYINDIENIIVYNSEGEWIEIKDEISIHQLPPNVHHVLETKYPNFNISNAYTFKNKKVSGCYSITLTSPSLPTLEVLVTENGTIVK